MRSALLAGLILLIAVLGAVLFGLTGLSPDHPAEPPSADQPALTERWISNTTRDVKANHHAPVAGRVAGHALVIAPISGVAHHHDHETTTTDPDHDHTPRGGGCALVTLHGANGTIRWTDRVPPANCTIHSVADPALADINGDGTEEILAATTERTLKAFDPLTGEVTFQYNLSSYGYTEPLVANVTGDSDPEIVIVDVKGSVFVVKPNGTTVWRDLHNTYTWGQPHVAAFATTGPPGLFVALGTGTMLMYDAHDGTVRWRRTLNSTGSITWTTTGQVDEDDGVEVVVATDTGVVRLYDGQTGAVQWSQSLAEFAAVRAFGDGDGDGSAEVYAVARDGVVRSLAATTGDVEWATNISRGPAQMMPPPALGDLDGDGSPEVVAVTNHGRVAVLDPTTGAVVATYERELPIFTHVELADTDGDGGKEIYVMYANGQVVALEYTGA